MNNYAPTPEQIDLAAQAFYEYRNYGDYRNVPSGNTILRHEAETWLCKVGPLVAAQALAERDEARAERDRARALACRLEEELALIRRAAAARRHG